MHTGLDVFFVPDQPNLFLVVSDHVCVYIDDPIKEAKETLETCPSNSLGSVLGSRFKGIGTDNISSLLTRLIVEHVCPYSFCKTSAGNTVLLSWATRHRSCSVQHLRLLARYCNCILDVLRHGSEPIPESNSLPAAEMMTCWWPDAAADFSFCCLPRLSEKISRVTDRVSPFSQLFMCSFSY